jgi:hypothetical protein
MQHDKMFLRGTEIGFALRIAQTHSRYAVRLMLPTVRYGIRDMPCDTEFSAFEMSLFQNSESSSAKAAHCYTST